MATNILQQDYMRYQKAAELLKSTLERFRAPVFIHYNLFIR